MVSKVEVKTILYDKTQGETTFFSTDKENKIKLSVVSYVWLKVHVNETYAGNRPPCNHTI